MPRAPMKTPAWARDGRRLAAALALLSLAALPSAARSAMPDLVDRTVLRVCADPANLPFSDQQGAGFENKIADLVAARLGRPKVIYTWFPQAIGFVRNTLRAHKCDLIIGFAQGNELVQNTNHYYTSAYVLLVRHDSDLAGIESLDDPRLQGHKVGVVAGTPPATIMALNGLIKDAVPFPLMVDRRYDSPAEKMVDELAKGEIDAGTLWGPIGGYYAKRAGVPIDVVPLLKEHRGPQMAYRITMGIRPNEPDWKHELNELIKAAQPDIDAILRDYGVPLLDDRGRPLPPQ